MMMNILRTLFCVVLTVMLFACATVQEQEREDTKNLEIANTNVRLGLGYLQQGRAKEALEKLQRALVALPDYTEAHSVIALVYGELDENEKAEMHYQQALELSPKDGSIHNNYAVFLCRTGRPAEAERYFLQAIKSRNYRTPAQAFENLGVCALKITDLKKAEKYLRKALQINPRLPTALLKMAQISVSNKRAMSGRAYLARYQEVAALNAEGLWLGIQVEKELGDLERVRDYENRLYRHFPDSEELRSLIESKKQENEKAGLQKNQAQQKFEADGK